MEYHDMPRVMFLSVDDVIHNIYNSVYENI